MWKVEHVETIPPPGLTKTIYTEITLSPDRAPQVVEQVEGEVEPRWKEVPHLCSQCCAALAIASDNMYYLRMYLCRI